MKNYDLFQDGVIMELEKRENHLSQIGCQFASTGFSKMPEELAVSHTLIFAMKIEGGAILAGADGRVSMGSLIGSEDVQKILEIDEKSLMLISGVAGISREVAEAFRQVIEVFEADRQRPLPVKGKVKILRRFVWNILPLALLYNLVTIPIFCSFDEQKKKGRIFSFDITGDYREPTDDSADFLVGGSGSVSGGGDTLLHRLYRPRLSLEKAIAISRDLVKEANRKDQYCGPKLFARVLDENGIRILS